MRTSPVRVRQPILPATGESAASTGPAATAPPEPLAPTPSALRAAARRVLDRWTIEGGEAAGAEEITQVLASLIEGAAMHRRGEAVVVEPKANSVLGRRLLELLRARVVDGWQEAPASPATTEMLDVLEALEAVREAIEPSWDEYFASRLSGPGGLDLVVEVAHDLRSPLTSILFLAETLQRGQSGEVNDVQRRQLGLIYSAALGLSAVASDVIELARGGDRLLDKDPQPFSVTELMESVEDIVRPIAEEKGLSVRLLPPDSDHRVGHPLALSRVLLNLTTNGLKFTDEGFVEITTRPTGHDTVEFSVRDTGRGMNEEALASLYQPFRRKPGRDEYCFSGTGLGLAICRKLVEAMESQLYVETRPKWGTRFYFDLKLPPSARL